MYWRNKTDRARKLIDALSSHPNLIFLEAEGKNNICQLSGIRFRICPDFTLEKEDFYDIYLNPNKTVPKRLQECTGLSMDFFKQCPDLKTVREEFLQFLKSSHLFLSFDPKTIQWLEEQLKIHFRNSIPLLEYARDCLPELDSFNLETIAYCYGEGKVKFHNSLYNINAEAAMLVDIVYKYQEILLQESREHPKRKVRFNWASCWENPHAGSQKRIKVNIDEGLYGNIYWDILEKHWSCKEDKESKKLFQEIDLRDLEKKVLSKYGNNYNASCMEDLGKNWLHKKKASSA